MNCFMCISCTNVFRFQEVIYGGQGYVSGLTKVLYLVICANADIPHNDSQEDYTCFALNFRHLCKFFISEIL